MAAKTDLVIGLMEVTKTHNQIAFAGSLKTCTWNYIEDPVSTITVFRWITATLSFKIIDIFRIELRPNRVSYVCVWHRNAVNQPGHLMTAAQV